MMELKVECDCGQRYKFDVEPVSNRMPYTVNCPVCGADGTEKANLLLQQKAPATAPAPIPVLVAESSAPPPPEPVGAPKLRISAAAARPAAGSPPPIAPIAPIAPPSALRPAGALATGSDKPAKKPNFWMGILGAFLGTLVGSIVYFLIFKFTGLRIKLLAIGVGYLAGAGAELLGKGEGSKELGGIAAILALVGIVAAQYFVALNIWHSVSLDSSAYAQSVADAKEAVTLIPTGSDAEIRSYLVMQAVEDGDDTNSISADDINQFRQKQLPELKGLASGQITEAQYNAKNGINAAQEKKDEDSTFKDFFLLLMISRLNIVSLCAAAALAYKVSANA